MVTVTVHWRDGDEDYEFENEDSARWFMADALRKCGSVKVTYKSESAGTTGTAGVTETAGTTEVVRTERIIPKECAEMTGTVGTVPAETDGADPGGNAADDPVTDEIIHDGKEHEWEKLWVRA